MRYVHVPHGVHLNGEQLFHRQCATAPGSNYLLKLVELVFNRNINPGKVFDLTHPLAQVAEAIGERRAVKSLLHLY